MLKNKWIIRLFHAFVLLTGFIPALIFLKPRIHLAPGAKRTLPKACILVSNHISLMDFVVYLLIFPFRAMRFLVAEVLYKRNKLLAIFLKLIGCIHVDRDAKTFDFVSNALEALDSGSTIGIFPQGRLPLKGQKFPFTVSTAFIAMHTTAPIVPIYTQGNYGLFKRANVVIGAPICLQDYCKEGLSEQEQLAHLTKVLEDTVYSLQEELKK